jgi:hypothetical protein
MKIRTSPIFPQAIKDLVQSISTYWRELAKVISDFDYRLSSVNYTGTGTTIGDKTNGDYLEIEDDGTIEMHGDATVFRDELGDLTGLAVLGTGIAIDTAENEVKFAPGCDPTNDYLYANVQMNHDRLHGAKVYPHIHWVQASDQIPNWLLQYRWQRNGSTKVTAWTNYPMKSNAFTLSGTSFLQISYGAGLTPPANDGISDIMQVRVSRDKGNISTAFSATDSYTGTVNGISFDIHLELDTLGSRQEYVK